MFLLPIYQSAAIQYGVPWQILAAINEVETNYGNDLNISTAGAVGWMQFMPETWLRYGVDVQSAGYADPYNPVDAIFAAARYLRAAGASKDLKGAIFAYNHSQAYVESVLLRAKLIADYPSEVVATLTGLAEGRLPIAGALATREVLISPNGTTSLGAGTSASTASRSASTRQSSNAGAQEGAGTGVAPTPSESAAGISRKAPERFVDLSAAAGTPVVAVQDGKIVAIGRSPRLGRYVVLRDVYGDVFTYADMGSVARVYSSLKLSGRAHVPGVAVAGAASSEDAAPSQAATAGTQPPVTLKASEASAAEAESASEEAGSLGKVRMFARPGSSYAKAAVARAAAAGELAGGRQALRVGAVVSQGTVLGTATDTASGKREVMRFAVAPEGDPGTVAAQPVLQSWRQLYSALHPEGARRDAGLLGATAGDAFLLSGAQLRSTVLSDPGIGLDSCARHDISIGAVDSRVLATLVFLSRSGLKPTVGSVSCERAVKGGFSVPGSGVRSTSNAVQIVRVNGIAVAGHQGAGSIADLTIRTLLTLQGRFAPSEIDSLMRYPGSPSTVASAAHADSIRVIFAPEGAAGSAEGSTPAGTAHVSTAPTRGAGARGAQAGSASVGLGSGQWSAFFGRVGTLPQPKVTRKRSSAAISDPRAAKPGK